MKNVRKLTALTRAGIIESLQFRLGTAVTLFGNLIYLIDITAPFDCKRGRYFLVLPAESVR